jgi:transcriptional regulator with XRE-family HTH domain
MLEEVTRFDLNAKVGDVTTSTIGDSLRAARTRLGWSREALAYHSGVSWSAIAQIESGRRKDVRLKTLSALANALGVSVDHLIGTPTAPPSLFGHRVLTYPSDDGFVAGSIPFLTEGIDASHALLAVTTKAKTDLIRDSLEDRAEQVEFADWADWYRSPQEAMRRYGAFMTQKLGTGATWIRVVAEAAWQGDSDADIAAWTRYESLVNLAFASSPATIVCTYDERSFPAAVLDDARRTHPEIAHGDVATASPTYRAPEDFLVSPESGSG